MGIAKVKKVELLALSSVRLPLLASLQEAGLVHLEEISAEEFGLNRPRALVTALDQLLHRLKHVLDYLSSQERKGLLEKLMARKPVLSCQAREKRLRITYLPVLNRLEKMLAKRDELLSRVKFCENEIDELLPLESLDVPLSSFLSFEDLEIVVGTIPRSRQAEFARTAEEEAIWSEVICEEDRRCHVFLFLLKKEKGLFETKL
ncbi:MAG: hypothetical protein AB1715_10045, partial [Acidobacteriota bacterium]